MVDFVLILIKKMHKIVILGRFWPILSKIGANRDDRRSIVGRPWGRVAKKRCVLCENHANRDDLRNRGPRVGDENKMHLLNFWGWAEGRRKN
jgi:hypothetical protein